MKSKTYEKELRKLQAELVAVQEWVKNTGQRIVIVFEGRDAAGKGGIIKAITARVSPRLSPEVCSKIFGNSPLASSQ
jgi:polyphosphate kinase 2 (PPK2 family)